MRQVIKKERKRESKDRAGRGVWIEEEWEMDEERKELKNDRGRKWEKGGGGRLMMEKKAKKKRKEGRRDKNKRNRKGNGDEEEGG